MWPLGLVPSQDEGPPKLAVFDQFGPQKYPLVGPEKNSVYRPRKPPGCRKYLAPNHGDFSINYR